MRFKVAFALFLVAFSIAGALFLSKKFIMQKKYEIFATSHSVTQHTGLSLCFLYGELRDAKEKENAKQGMEIIGNLLRIRFDAQNIEECKELTTSYCHNQIALGHVFAGLKLIIHGNKLNPVYHRFLVTKECVLKNVSKLDENSTPSPQIKP